MEIMWIGIILCGGWLWAYLFIRQLIFNVKIAYPTIKKMKSAKEDLISVNADRYTTVSVAVCCFFIALAVFLIVFFFRSKILFLISFFAGAIVCIGMMYSSIKPENKKLFESFCSAYYRFVPDDELRTAMYNRKTSQMKLRLHDMDVSTEFIPVFEKDK